MRGGAQATSPRPRWQFHPIAPHLGHSALKCEHQLIVFDVDEQRTRRAKCAVSGTSSSRRMLSSVDSLLLLHCNTARIGLRCSQLSQNRHQLELGSWNSRRRCALQSDQRPKRLTLRAMASPVDATLQSWDELAGLLPNDDALASRLPNAKKRVFEAGQAPALVFYRDNSSWCPYCERVWLQLEEKRIPYEIEKVNMRCYGEKPAWFMKMVPSGLLPVLQLDGNIVTESMDIMFLLEDRFPDHTPLLPSSSAASEAEAEQREAVPALLALERRLFGAWLSRLKSSWPDMGAFDKTMDQVNDALRRFGGPYFLGDKFSMVDAVYAPFLERIAASMPYWPGVKIRGNDRWPAVNGWFDAMDSRPAYQAMKSDDFTHTHDLEPQIGPCRSAPAGQAYRDKINGKDGGWELPLQPEHTAWGFDDGTGAGGAKHEAARTLISNHDKVVGFALRGLPGGGDKYRDDVDMALHLVANALVQGVDTVPAGVAANSVRFPEQVAVAAAYLRDLVGVPRDLSYPAARQLRAHLNWLIRSLGSDL